MALLSEYALTPDVFDVTSYSSEEVCGLHLEKLREPLMHEGIVRDLRDGGWSQVFVGESVQWHRVTKELLKKLSRGGRLVRFKAVLEPHPTDAVEWCKEALAGHSEVCLAGIVTTGATAEQFRRETMVAAIDRLAGAPWWQARSASLRLPRTIAAYRGALDPFLRHANSLMFIDPHLDPARRGYADFHQVLAAVGSRQPAPRIEVHRVCYRGSGPGREILRADEIEASFRRGLAEALRGHGLAAEVFVWDDFHYRCLISNLGGLLLENGFDVSAASGASTIWSRLGRDVRDDIQREFDPASNRHPLRHKFTLP